LQSSCYCPFSKGRSQPWAASKGLGLGECKHLILISPQPFDRINRRFECKYLILISSAIAPALLSIAVPDAILPSAIHGFVPPASMQSSAQPFDRINRIDRRFECKYLILISSAIAPALLYLLHPCSRHPNPLGNCSMRRLKRLLLVPCLLLQMTLLLISPE
jgi:hypothetical protein